MKAEKEQWVKEVMQSLDGIQPAQVSTGLYHKLRNRIDAGDFKHFPEMVSTNTIWRMAAALFLIVALNAVTCIVVTKNNPNAQQEKLRGFAKEFSLTPETYNY